METFLVSGVITPNTNREQEVLHQKLGELITNIKRQKDAGEVRQDTLQAIPLSRLPMVF